jgi:hypothetical protein
MKAKEGNPCAYFFALAIIGFVVYLIYEIAKFFTQPDALAQIGNTLAALGMCVGAAILFVLVGLAGMKLDAALKTARADLDTWRTLKRVKRLLLQRNGQTQFLTRSTVLDLANKSRFRTSNVIVGDPYGNETSIPYSLRGPCYTPPYWEAVESLMEQYIAQFNQAVKPDLIPETELRKVLGDLMLDFYKIHPLKDGNKRLGLALGEMAANKYGYTIQNGDYVKTYLQGCAMGEWTPKDDAVELEKIN